MSSFAFIGAGNMGGAIIKAVCRAVDPKTVAIFDFNEARVSELCAETGCKAANSAINAVSVADFVFMCVKPQVFEAALSDISGRLEGKTLVSIAAGVQIAKIKEILSKNGADAPVIRLMPNTPVAVGKGMIVMAKSADVPEESAAVLSEALREGGLVSPVDEKLIDAATGVFSCSPAFVYMFIEALADGGVEAGVPRDKAQLFAAQAVLGSAQMVLETGKHPGQLKDEVCSPGGSTIVGVETLEKNGFRGAVAEAVYNAYEKTAKLGK